MADNFVTEGDVFTWTNSTGSAVVAGQVVKIGQTLGVAAVDIANGASGSVYMEGVFTVPKVTAAVIAQGESVIWDVSVGKFDDNLATPATGDVSNAAIAFESAGSTATTIKVHFDHKIGTVT